MLDKDAEAGIICENLVCSYFYHKSNPFILFILTLQDDDCQTPVNPVPHDVSE